MLMKDPSCFLRESAMLYRTHCWGIALAALGLLAGCNNQDNERLARIARAAAARMENAGDGSGLAGIRGLDQTALGSRVAARIRWDKAMEGAAVEVRTQGGEVELKGNVRDLAQRVKAVSIATETVGTESVIDSLTMPKPEP